MKQFTVIACRWFDKINGNTYHSVRCIRHSDNAVCVGGFRYGYEDHYQQTALMVMFDAGWLPYKEFNKCHRYEMDNNYPIIWTVSDGLKRDCVANGKL